MHTFRKLLKPFERVKEKIPPSRLEIINKENSLFSIRLDFFEYVVQKFNKLKVIILFIKVS